MRERSNKHKSYVMENNVTAEHLLIVHFSSGDEIHFDVLDVAHLDAINQLVQEDFQSGGRSDEISDLVTANSLQHFKFQSYVNENVSGLSKFNVTKCIHIPQLGC